MIQAYIFADDSVLISDSQEKLQKALTKWQEELLRNGMLINFPKRKVVMFSRKEEKVHIYDGEELEIVDDFSYLGTSVSNNATANKELSNQIRNANQVYYQINNTMLGKREVTIQVKLHIFKAVYLPTLLYGTENWIALNKYLSRLIAAEMKYLH